MYVIIDNFKSSIKLFVLVFEIIIKVSNVIYPNKCFK